MGLEHMGYRRLDFFVAVCVLLKSTLRADSYFRGDDRMLHPKLFKQNRRSMGTGSKAYIF